MRPYLVDKAMVVVASCRTREQLDSAVVYAKLVARRLGWFQKDEILPVYMLAADMYRRMGVMS